MRALPQLAPRSLTGRLLAGMLLVCALALGIALFAATLLLRDYLYARAADQVTALRGGPAIGASAAVGPQRLCDLPSAPDVLPSEFRLVVVSATGGVRCQVPASASGPPTPSLVDLRARAEDAEATVVRGEDGPWATAVVAPGTATSGDYVVVAVSLRDADDTVDRLRREGLAVSAGVLAALAVAGWWVIRIGLRPLAEVRKAAAAIEPGDLSGRVPAGDPGTEVGDLAAALNTMLGEVERSVDERRASEGRIRQFAADASHELRTPLTSIKGYAQLYAQLAPTEGTGADRDDVVRRIDSEADRMTGIVEDLLLLARLDQEPTVHREPVDLVEVVHDVLAAARVRQPGRRLDLVAPGPVEVSGDPVRLRQVLANLVGNALVHTSTPVVVRVRQVPDGAEVDVADQGPGMPAEVRDHVFDRFFRADAGRSHAVAGSGLGLAIVRALVEAHGGTVTCASDVVAGSTFTVRLPGPDAAT